jgi:hypothetical protein
MAELQLYALGIVHDSGTKICYEVYLCEKFGNQAEKAFDKVRAVPKLSSSSQEGVESNHNNSFDEDMDSMMRSGRDSEVFDPSNEDTMNGDNLSQFADPIDELQGWLNEHDGGTELSIEG